MGADLGNVVQSRGFQFVEVELADPFVIDGDLMWSPRTPTKLAPVKSKWIYAFQISSDGQKAILAAEYNADRNGALTFVPGAKRRLVEPAAAPKKGAPIPEVGLPLVFQGDAVRYAFVVTRGRLGKAAIWGLENRLSSLYLRKNLADPSVFLTGPDNRLYLPVVDPLTVALNLHLGYEKALNEAINYVSVNPHNPHNEDVKLRSAKYQLAKMIQESLLSSEHGGDDPLKLKECLAGGGAMLRDFISDEDSAIAKLQGKSRSAARVLIRFLNTEAIVAHAWYLGTSQASNLIGHFWVDAVLSCLGRLSETEEGRRLQQQLVNDADDGLLSYLFAPAEDASEEAQDNFAERFPIARKAVTGVAVGLAEMAPALLVYGKASRAANMRRIAATLRGYLVSPKVLLVTGRAPGRVTALVGLRPVTIHITVETAPAKADLEKWIEEGKPHWPEETRRAKLSEILGKILMCVELVNLYSALLEFDEKRTNRSTLEAAGAVIDMIVALEDPIRAVVGPGKAPELAEGAVAAEESAVEGSAAAEQAGFLERLTAPAMFKLLGAASAAIDMYINWQKKKVAASQGNRGLAAGYGTVSVASGVIVAASITNGIGYYAGAAALTAASATLLVVGVFVLVVGFAIIAHFTKSSWQMFASRCIFGVSPAEPGHTKWSGGDFSAWTETLSGINRQIEVLTGMLCSFTMSGAFKTSGHGSDAETVAFTFGALPPNARLLVDFTIRYSPDVVHRPSYQVSLDKLAVTCTGDARNVADLQPYWREERLHSLVVTADRPPAAEGAKVLSSSCEVHLEYADPHQPRKIPPGDKPCKYKIYDGSSVNYREASSLGDEEEEEKEDEGGHGNELRTGTGGE